jgi:hypothetical protein
MNYYSLIALIFFAMTAKAQVPFNEKYKDCTTSDTCFYCGDTPAHYKKSILDRIQRSLEHGTVQWMSTSGRIFFEVEVDSTGHSCVRSIKDETHMSDIKNNLRSCINNLWDWAPAESSHRAINSTVILELHFIGDNASVRFVRPGDTQ